MKSQRLTVKSHNIAFLQNISAQMGLTDLSEVLNYLLLDAKGLGYSFGNKPAPQPQQAPIGYNFDPSTFEPAYEPIHNNQNVVDPTIQRLIDAGLEMDF
ncbi:MAG: hypothetical protein KME22_09295 [Hassallia sp. WJT32-NPBG1]|nr:hypothetical protein [Hassallia sp. WJT32-NPBG1]